MGDNSASAPAADPVALLLSDKRSAATRRAYRADLSDFFRGDLALATVRAFLTLPKSEVVLRLAHYKAELLERGMAEATVNRRLSAVRALLKLSHRLGVAETDGHGLVDSEKLRAYRDTRGVDLATMRRLVAAPGTENLRGRRDTALLRLMCENALRRAEVCALDVADFLPGERRLRIQGKGRGSQKEPVTLSRGVTEAIAAYLEVAGHRAGALFRNLDRRPGHAGGRLTPDGLYQLVGDYGRAIGVENLTPHKLRHSAITAALDATNGDVRRVQRLSRHAKLETLVRYDDNRTDLQGDVTRQLSALLGD